MRLLAPLELMYPNRCYDCLAVCSPDELLCPACAVVMGRSAVTRPEPETAQSGSSDASAQVRSSR